MQIARYHGITVRRGVDRVDSDVVALGQLETRMKLLFVLESFDEPRSSTSN
jgi:hypothetical protein